VHRYDDAGWVLLSQGLDGGPHRGSGRQTVIDQNDGPTADIRRRTIAPIEPLAARQLLQLGRKSQSSRSTRLIKPQLISGRLRFGGRFRKSGENWWRLSESRRLPSGKRRSV
jgi:hypothetical protein